MADHRETLALLFTDIEGSTNLLRTLGADYRKLLSRHRRLLRDAFDAYGGNVVGGEGDSLFVTFSDAASAIRGAVDGQIALVEETWPGGAQVRVRMGIHVGEVIRDEDDFVGLAVHQTARISNAAHGAQVLVSEATQSSSEALLPDGVSLLPVGQFRLKDFPEPQVLYQLHHPWLPSDFPAPRTAGGPRHNLPRTITSFIGRDREVAELIDLLETSRLVTLTGPGGCGKTRLAIESATASLALRGDGVWFVDLAPISDPQLVADTAASAMGIQETRDRPPEVAVREFLAAGSPLVILDNCEHLISACTDLTEDLLSTCPGLTILVTAREPLGIAGEVIRRVPGLEVPSAEEGDESAEAVMLFLERARAQDPEFDPLPHEIGEIGQLTRRLDGIPLAIEMAAALVGTLSVKEIVSRLDDRFRLLTGGSGRGMGRQQTLLATVEWSHELLEEAERTLLRRLAVMTGSFSFDDIEAVCVGDEIETPDVVGLVRRLVATSWVMKERAEDHTRYRMLETSRQYALEKLIQSGEAERIRSRHCEWFTQLAEDAVAPMHGGLDQMAWFDRIELGLDNFRSAMSWGLSEGDALSSLRIAASLSRFWEVRGHWAEGLRWLEESLAAAPHADDSLRAPAIIAASFLAFYRGRFDLAHDMVQQGLALARANGDQRSEARALRYAAVIEHRLGKSGAALASAERAVEMCRTVSQGSDLAFALQVLGRLQVDGSREEARESYEKGLEVARSARDGISQIYLLYALGQLSIREGKLERAREFLSESLQVSRQVGERWMAMNALVALSQVSDEVDAESALEEMVGLLRQIGNKIMLLAWLRQLAYRRRLEGDHGAARKAVDEALVLVEELGTDEAKALGHYLLGSHLDEADRDYRGALVEFRAGLRLSHELGSKWEMAFGLGSVVRMLAMTGDFVRAAVTLGAADKLREAVGMHATGRREEVRRDTVEVIGRALGDPERERLWAKGAAMSLDEAIDLAVKEN